MKVAQSTHFSEESSSDGEDVTALQLDSLGRKAVLSRKFDFWAILGFSCTVMGTWEGVFSTVLQIGFQNGGPSGTIYSFIVVWLGTLATFACLGELSSMAPTSSAQYHWVAMLAPKSTQRTFSYVTGWLTVCGWIGGNASATGINAGLIQGLIKLTHPDYDMQTWQLVLLFWAIVAFAVAVNSLASWLLPRFEQLMLVLHILGFFAILIPMLALSKHQDASEVFASFYNGGGWSTQGLSFVVGMTSTAFVFAGADAAFHMAEEVYDAPRIVPGSVLFTITLNGAMGLAMTIAAQFSIQSVDDILSSPTMVPAYGLFLQATRSVAGSATMGAILATLSISAAAGVVASASRLLWAFSRDKGVPGWQAICQVNKRVSVPVRSLGVVATVMCLLALIYFGSSTALQALVSIGVVGLYFSYLLTVSLLLWRRCVGDISVDAGDYGGEVKNTIGKKLVWGPWRMPGAVGIVVNVFACAYLLLVMFFAFWPAAVPVTASSMNYGCLLFGVVCIGSLLYYALWARKNYVGPQIDA